MDRNAAKKKVIKYAIYALLMLVFSYAKVFTEYSPFALAFFVGLVFCKQNIAIISPMYVAATAIATQNLAGLLLPLVPCVCLYILYFIHQHVEKKVRLYEINIITALSQAPLFFYGTTANYGSIIFFIAATLLLVNIFCCFFYAVLVRGIASKLTTDEIAGGSLFLTAIFYGLYLVQPFGITPVYFVLALFLMFTQAAFGVEISAVASLLCGVGIALGGAGLECVAAVGMAILVAGVFHRSSRIVAGISYELITVLTVYYFGVPCGNELAVVISTAVGIIIYELIPIKYASYLGGVRINQRSSTAARNIIGRNRRHLHSKLIKIAGCFSSMGNSIAANITGKSPLKQNITRMATKLEESLCEGCTMRANCIRCSGGKVDDYFAQLIEATFSRGRPTILELPQFFSSNCHKVNIALNTAFELVEEYKSSAKIAESAASGKRIIAEQMKEVGTLIENVADEVKDNVSYNPKLEEKLIEDLAYVNIICSEAIVYIDKEQTTHLFLTVRECDSHKPALVKTASRVLKCPLLVCPDNYSYYDGMVTLEFLSLPRLDMVYGMRTKVKNGSNSSGDTKAVRRIAADKLLIAVSDGMGSGSEANAFSNSSIGMIEAFYMAGFADCSVLNMTNRLLVQGGSDNFSAMDLSVIDLRSGKADFIKLASPASYIISGDSIEKIESRSLPMGIVEEMVPITITKYLCGGDMVLWMSDGVADALGEDKIRRIITTSGTLNPQNLCDNIMNEVGSNGDDDCMCLCARIFSQLRTV